MLAKWGGLLGGPAYRFPYGAKHPAPPGILVYVTHPPSFPLAIGSAGDNENHGGSTHIHTHNMVMRSYSG